MSNFFINPSWFNQGSSFRYLHDEISDGVVAASLLRSKESYTDSAVNVGDPAGSRIEYGFVNNLVNLSDVASDWPLPTGARFYNQLDYADGIQGGATSGWDGSQLMKGDPNAVLQSTFTLVESTDSLTWVFVCPNLDADLGESYFFMGMNNDFRLQYSGDNLWFQINGTSGFSRNVYTSTRTSGVKLIIATYDGSESRNGLNLYINDITTPLTVDSTAGDVNSGYGFSSNMVIDTDQTFVNEIHLFRKEFDLSERETAKEILEQYYTFS